MAPLITYEVGRQKSNYYCDFVVKMSLSRKCCDLRRESLNFAGQSGDDAAFPIRLNRQNFDPANRAFCTNGRATNCRKIIPLLFHLNPEEGRKEGTENQRRKFLQSLNSPFSLSLSLSLSSLLLPHHPCLSFPSHAQSCAQKMERESEVVIIPPEGANGPTKEVPQIFPQLNP